MTCQALEKPCPAVDRYAYWATIGINAMDSALRLINHQQWYINSLISDNEKLRAQLKEKQKN
jgi:hypothetical protein